MRGIFLSDHSQESKNGVIWFWNNEALLETDAALTRVLEYLPGAPLPDPLPLKNGGEGERQKPNSVPTPASGGSNIQFTKSKTDFTGAKRMPIKGIIPIRKDTPHPTTDARYT